MLNAGKVLASLMLVISLYHLAAGKHISLVRAPAARFEMVKKIGEPINLKINNAYINWYKNPDIEIGSRFFEDDFHTISRVGDEAFKSLTIKKANFTDAGQGAYYGLSEDEDEDGETTSFDLYLYDLVHHKSSMGYEDDEVDLHKEDPDGNKVQKLKIELKSFEKQEELNLKYRKEAMPLDALLVNGKKINSESCNHEEDGLLVRCLEVNLGKEIPLESCKNKASFEFGYQYENESKFTGVAIKKYSFKTEVDVLYPPKLDERAQIVVYNDASETIKLDCETTCANPSDKLEYEWTLNGKVVKEQTTSHFEFTFASLDLEEHSAEIVCTVSNGIDAGDYLNESQKTFTLRYAKDPETTTPEPTTPETVTDTTAAVNPAKPTNGTSEFGFFGNLYNKMKFFVQFNF